MPRPSTTPVSLPNHALSRRSDWQPIIGPEMTRFLKTVPESSRLEVKKSAVAILGRGISPNDSGPRDQTGLVVGYVQSGKTMSFEALAALSRDNDFRVVIVIAGVSNSLLSQSTERLCRDLGVHDYDLGRRWLHYKNPTDDDATRTVVSNLIEDWRDLAMPSGDKRTLLVTVLKNHHRLDALASLLRRVDITEPVLIIDDEADQASLNVEVKDAQWSTTYRRLMEIRDALPVHNFFQYTATPQAPLLISIIDWLSPNFVHVLNPGSTYVGGKCFLGDDKRYVRLIPDTDVPTKDNPLSEPPAALVEALGLFVVGVTASLASQTASENRSMLVHPSHGTTQHQEYYNWVQAVIGRWKTTVKLDEQDLDRRDLIDDLRRAYRDLSDTTDGMPEFHDMIRHLPRALRDIQVLEVNTRQHGRTPSVEWHQAYAWILVGGQAMDRGFTVKGLTVTYMPRGIGVGNADTVQQRARFFGYKKDYLGYCRVYVEQDTLAAFQHYVDHEEHMRRELQQVQSSGSSLNEWTRKFVLDRSMQPCRSQVLKFGYMRTSVRNEWFVPKTVRMPEPVLQGNRKVVDTFVRRFKFVDTEWRSDQLDTHRHQVCRDVSLMEAVKELLVPFRVTAPLDTQQKTMVLLQLSHVLQRCDTEQCVVYRMSPRAPRRRDVDDGGVISELFQGAHPDKRGTIYRGDRHVRDNDFVSIQIHTLKLGASDDDIIAVNVPVVAVWLPARYRLDVLVQRQPLQEE